MIKLIFSKIKNKTFNIGNNNEPTKIIDLAKLIYKLTQKNSLKKVDFIDSDRSSAREIYVRKPTFQKRLKN